MLFTPRVSQNSKPRSSRSALLSPKDDYASSAGVSCQRKRRIQSELALRLVSFWSALFNFATEKSAEPA
jgi:hypothetical protein